ncbi:hypothetical protein NHG28_07885 [Aerococcaceae bacterium NML201209]|nr:hypothetical protein [Aerococcaceae bacterium NML201209]MCW6665851.1 hypothetical protein [Aerococcaceae bacterium NML191219]
MKVNYSKLILALKYEDYHSLVEELHPLLLKNVKGFPRDMQKDILQEYAIICIQLAKSILQESKSERGHK